MPGIARVGVDTAGGTELGGGQSYVRIDGAPISVVGDDVASHAPCPKPSSHCAATLAAGSPLMRIDGIAVVRAGDTASCGHASTGATWITAE